MADSPRIEELRRRVQSDPASIAFAALAEEYRRAGRFDDAIATCSNGLQRHPSYLSAHVTLGRALLEVGRFEEAQQELEYVLKLAPENLAAIRGLAEIHHRRGDDQPAREAQPAAVAVTDFPRERALPPIESRAVRPAPAPTQVEAPPAIPEPAADVRFRPEPTPGADPVDIPLQAEAMQEPADSGRLAALQDLLAAIQRARSNRQSAGR